MLNDVTDAAFAVNDLDDFKHYDNRDNDGNWPATDLLEMFKELKIIKANNVWRNPGLIPLPLYSTITLIPEQSELVELSFPQETAQKLNKSTHYIIIEIVRLMTPMDEETFAALTISWGRFNDKENCALMK